VDDNDANDAIGSSKISLSNVDKITMIFDLIKCCNKVGGGS